MVDLHSSIFSRLRGLLDVTRLVRSENDLPTLLTELARTVAESLGFGTVVVNLYRPAWDRFEVIAVHGNEEARRLLLGETRDSEIWKPLLDPRFERRGAFLIPHGEFDWDAGAVATYVPESGATADGPEAWHPEDALLVPMRHTDGHLLGILSVDEPVSGRTPDDDELDVLVAVAGHAALALQSAQEAAQSARHRLALEKLLAVSSTLIETRSLDAVLSAVCTGVSDALGFGRAAVELVDPATGAFAVHASVGLDEVTAPPLTLEQFERLLEPSFEVEGCYLLPCEEARKRLPRDRPYTSSAGGRGPHAWHDHWLFVPLPGRDGRTIGCLWVDAPADRLLPPPERLQALRAFANQAAAALDAAARFEELRESNERRRALIDASPLAIVDLDRDGRVRSWNPAAERLFGWRAAEVIGGRLPTVPEERLPELQANLERVLAGESTTGAELQRIRRDGTRIDIDLSTAPLRDAAGEVVGVMSVMADVTERRRAERALVASEARTAAVLAAALDCVITIDHEGRIVDFNPAAEETFGWTSGEVFGRSFLDLALPSSERVDLEETFRTGSTPLLGQRLEIEALNSDGRAFSAELVVSRVPVEGPPLFTACLRDITRRKAQEEQLRETAAKYRALVERLPIATYLNDLGMPIRTTWISPQIEAMLGYLPEEWLADGFFEERLHPDDRARVLAAIERTHLTGEHFRAEYRLLAKDGRVVRVRDETVAVRDEEYRPLFLQGFLIDLDDRAQDAEQVGEPLRLVG